MSGTGNDFVIIDNRVAVIEPEKKRGFAKSVCTPKTSVGADGVIFVEDSDRADIKWDFYNADGSTAEMCGNGARCVARYALEKKIAPANLTLETLAGIITAEVKGREVRIRLTPPENVRQDIAVELNGARMMVDSVNTGVPHAILFSRDIEAEDVRAVGRGIRFHERFAPAGTNVDFVQAGDGHSLAIRTYERGVEDETLACGTGVVASALLASLRDLVQPPVAVTTRSGEILHVDFSPDNGTVQEVYLTGPTRTAFEGTLIEI